MQYSSVEIVIIQQIAPKSYAIRCPRCQGNGKRPLGGEQNKAGLISVTAWTAVCPICTGKGAIRVVTDDVPIPCAICKGQGFKAEKTSRFSQLRSSYYLYYDCDSCHGVGAQSLSGNLTVVK